MTMYLWLKLLAFGFAFLDIAVFVAGNSTQPSTQEPSTPTSGGPLPARTTASSPANTSKGGKDSSEISPPTSPDSLITKAPPTSWGNNSTAVTGAPGEGTTTTLPADPAAPPATSRSPALSSTAASPPLTSNSTTQDNASLPLTSNSTTQDKASPPLTSNSTTQDNASLPLTSNSTIQDKASPPLTSNSTTQDNASLPLTSNSTTQDKASPPLTSNPTTQDNTSDEQTTTPALTTASSVSPATALSTIGDNLTPSHAVTPPPRTWDTLPEGPVLAASTPGSFFTMFT